MEVIKNKIEDLVKSSLSDDSLFIVDVSLSLAGRGQKISVKIDGDQGVTIGQCAAVSRKLGKALETLNLIENAYQLEVSSPGADQPLRNIRQYVKNIGRQLKVKTTAGKILEGKLEKVENTQITLALLPSSKDKETLDTRQIPFNDIEDAKILLPF